MISRRLARLEKIFRPTPAGRVDLLAGIDVDALSFDEREALIELFKGSKSITDDCDRYEWLTTQRLFLELKTRPGAPPTVAVPVRTEAPQ
jgi:hypothetical protein